MSRQPERSSVRRSKANPYNNTRTKEGEEGTREKRKKKKKRKTKEREEVPLNFPALLRS